MSTEGAIIINTIIGTIHEYGEEYGIYEFPRTYPPLFWRWLLYKIFFKIQDRLQERGIEFEDNNRELVYDYILWLLRDRE